MREWISVRAAQPAGAAAPLTEADLREAYARGRRDERARRRRAPLAFLTVSLTALAGAGMLAATAWQGVFPGGGVDDQIADLTISAHARLSEAAADARGALAHGGSVARTRQHAHSPIGG